MPVAMSKKHGGKDEKKNLAYLLNLKALLTAPIDALPAH